MENTSMNLLKKSSLIQEYEDRFHKIMYPTENNTIPKQRDYLTTDDITGASPGSTGARIK